MWSEMLPGVGEGALWLVAVEADAWGEDENITLLFPRKSDKPVVCKKWQNLTLYFATIINRCRNKNKMLGAQQKAIPVGWKVLFVLFITDRKER